MNSLHYSTVKWPQKKQPVLNNQIKTETTADASVSGPGTLANAGQSTSLQNRLTRSPNIVTKFVHKQIHSMNHQNRLIATNRRNGFITKQLPTKQVEPEVVAKIYPPMPDFNSVFNEITQRIKIPEDVEMPQDPFSVLSSNSAIIPTIDDLCHMPNQNINFLPEPIDMSFKMVVPYTYKRADLKIAVVSAIFLIDFNIMDDCGSFDKIDGFDYFLFTNDKEKCSQMYDLSEWNIIELDTTFNCGVHATKHVKWLTHVYLPEYDNIIWVDSFISPNHERVDKIMEIIDLVNQVDSCPIYTRTQYLNNVGVDIEWCVNNNRINVDMKQTIVDYLDKHNYDVETPDQTYWTSVVIKNNKNQRLIDLSLELFRLIIEVGYRDQHWLPFLLQKYQLTASIIDNNSLFCITGQSNTQNHDYVSSNVSIHPQTRTLLIQQSGDYHYEIIESLIVKHSQIIGTNEICVIYLNSIGQYKNRSFMDYIIKKYPYVRIGCPTTYSGRNVARRSKAKQGEVTDTETAALAKVSDYYINSTIYPEHYDTIKDQDPTTHFYISHRIDESIYNDALNIFYLTPLTSYNLFYADILPFSNNNVKTTARIPIYVVQGAIDGSRRNYKLLEKIMSQSYEYEFKIRMVGRGKLPDTLMPYQDKIELLTDLNFIDYHKSFADCYCILPLITKNTHPQYYSDKLTSTINYARGYKLKCLIDQDLQDIYQLPDAEIFRDENNISAVFEKTLTEFYNFTDRIIT
jgi:hypothetical protein